MEPLAGLDNADPTAQDGVRRQAGRFPPLEAAPVAVRIPERAFCGFPCGIFRATDTRLRPRAKARERADWIELYELSKKPHRIASSSALRRGPIVMGPPHRGHV